MKPKETTHSSALAQLETQSRRLLSSLLSESRADASLPGPLRQDEILFAITGERGSGKTTLLRHVANSASSHGGLLWIPIVRPDNLASSQSLLVTVVSAFATLASRFLKSDDATTAELPALAERTFRSALFSQSGSVDELFENSGSLGQFTADAANLLRRGEGFEQELQRFVAALLNASNAKAIVVPIDDLDLIPSELGRVLADARMLGAQRGILPIACLSRSDLRAKLRAEVSASLPGMVGIELERLVDQQIMKTLRPDRVFQPLQLPRKDRLHFAPVGSDVTLAVTLKRLFDLMEGSERSPLSVWFDRQTTLSNQQSTLDGQWLPSTYRGLQHLHYEATALCQALEKRSWFPEVGSRVSAFLECISREHSSHTLSLEVESIRASVDGVRVQASADWPKLRLGVVASGQWKRLFQSGTTGTRVMLRRAERAMATVDSPDSQRSGEDRPVIAAQELAAALLSDSVLASRVFDEPKPVGPLAMLDNSCEFLQSVKVHGLPTDDRIILLPASTGIVHTGRWLASWNWIVTQHEGGNRGTSLLGADLCKATTAIWLQGDESSRTRAAVDFISELNLAAEHYVRLASMLGEDVRWSGNADAAFCDWFEVLLPRLFHDALLDPDEVVRGVGIWSAAVSTGGRGGSAYSRLSDWYEPRLRTEVSGRSRRERLWLYGYRVLLRNVSPELGQLLTDFAKEYEERKGRGSKGREALESVVQQQESSRRYSFAPRGTLEGKQQMDDILRLLDQLRQV